MSDQVAGSANVFCTRTSNHHWSGRLSSCGHHPGRCQRERRPVTSRQRGRRPGGL